MNITFVLPYAGLQGGIRVIAIYADHLARKGHDVRILSTPFVVSLKHACKCVLLGKGLPRHEPSYFDALDVSHRVLDAVRPVSDTDVADGDVVVATYYTTARGVQRLSPAKGAKVLFIQGYEIEEGKPNPMLDMTWRMPMHKIVVSAWLAGLAQQRFGDPVVSLVMNSVDTRQFHASPRTKQVGPTIGLLYSTCSLKGCSTSFRALERIAASRRVRLVCFGAERPDFRLPLPRYAEFHYRPAQHELRNLYAQCDVWLCGSNAEGFHLPPLEAMACRCPVVSTRVGGPVDIIEHGVNGFLVDVKDDEGLAQRVLQVLDLPSDDWKRMSDAAYRTATRYSWDDAARAFEQALYLAIERTKRRDFTAAAATAELA
jgi:glycosyltransferase involved in cell wall biosynthesis